MCACACMHVHDVCGSLYTIDDGVGGSWCVLDVSQEVLGYYKVRLQPVSGYLLYEMNLANHTIDKTVN